MKRLQVIKMAVAFFLAMTIAQFFDLQYTASAGIVGLLTIQNTRKETFQICLKRVLSFFLAFICAFIVFRFYGYSAMSFAIFFNHIYWSFFLWRSRGWHCNECCYCNALFN